MSDGGSDISKNGEGSKLLAKYGARIGQRVEVSTVDGYTTTGLLIPRYEHADSEYVVLKLKSGYNIGLKSGNIKAIKILEDIAPQRKTELGSKSIKRDERKNLLLLSTGGTIASRIDYRTGAVHPALAANDLYAAIPELGEIATIDPEVVFSVYSENIGPKEWQILSEKVVQRTNEKKPHGVVVMIGTDTMAYVSAALSFSTIGLGVPVVFVGAQRSTDRPSSDGALNLKAASTFAVESGMSGVFVAMHQNESDDSIAIHNGARVRKNHTSRRDAFESIDIPLVAKVKEKELMMTPVRLDGPGDEFRLKTSFSPDVALIKFYPGFDSSILEYLYGERKVRGFVIEGSGLGHVSSAAVSKIEELIKKGVFIGLTSQCIWGHVDLNVYETGRDMINAGVTPLENMLPETALAKLSWTLENFDDVKHVMLTNLVGEINVRLPLN